jgi:hypothetical protein
MNDGNFLITLINEEIAGKNNAIHPYDELLKLNV